MVSANTYTFALLAHARTGLTAYTVSLNQFATATKYSQRGNVREVEQTQA